MVAVATPGLSLSPSLVPSILRFALLMAGFVLPGYLLGTWLLEREGLSRPVRLALGFALSFALFAALGWPFLWFHRGSAEFLHLLYPSFAGYSAVGLAAALQARRRRPPSAHAGIPGAPLHGEGEASPVPERWPPLRLYRPLVRRPWPALSTYLVVVVSALFLYFAASFIPDSHPVLRATPLLLIPLLLIPLWRLSRRLPASWLSAMVYEDRDFLLPPRLWVAAAAGAVAIQVGCIAVYDRPDWDDCYYLATVLDYQQATALNAQEPTHREGLPVPAQERVLCWDLFGAVMCRLSGLSPAALMHTLVPIVLLLLCYGAYVGLLHELLPPRLVPLGVLGLSAVHLWGISSHASAANFLLPRLGQGKSVLLHLCAPLVATLLLRYAARPGWRVLVALILVVACGLGLSLTAIFLLLVLLFCLSLALFLTPALSSGLSSGAQEGAHWARVRVLFAAGCAALPLLAAGLLLRHAVRNEVSLLAQPAGRERWLDILLGYLGRGSAEWLWLLTLPLLALLLRGTRARAYLLIFPLVLALSFVNPLFFHLVAGSITSFHTYYRLLWLLPVAPGLSVLLALVCRLLAAVLPGAGAYPVRLPLQAALGGALCTMALPGLFVFGPLNNFIGPLGRPVLADNIEKIPAPLLSIAARLSADPEIRDVRILAGEAVVSFLTSYSPDFRYVQTRPMYTVTLFAAGGRAAEGIERALLASVLSRGSIPALAADSDWKDLNNTFGKEAARAMFGKEMKQAGRDLPMLLSRYRVRYAILGPGDQGAPALLSAGFRVVEAHGPFSLLMRSP